MQTLALQKSLKSLKAFLKNRSRDEPLVKAPQTERTDQLFNRCSPKKGFFLAPERPGQLDKAHYR